MSLKPGSNEGLSIRPSTNEPTDLKEPEEPKPSNSDLVSLKKRHSKVVPPLNFALVERQLYRSGQPAPINFPFLQQLELRSIIWLAVEDPSDAFLGFVDDNEINFHHLGLVTAENQYTQSNPWDQLTETSIITALNIMMNKTNYPLLVCCGLGRHRTGTVIGCLRRLQGWNLASISEEYRRISGSSGGRVLTELHIEAFDTSMVRTDVDDACDWILQHK